MTNYPHTQKIDEELHASILLEEKRQSEHLELIASENFTSKAVMEMQGSVLTNKYAEGYPARRYYGGCEFVDKAETLAIERAKALFSTAYANVQPHSGANANAIAFAALLKPGEKLLGMGLSQGGHLTHGAPFNFSGTFYQSKSYGLDTAGLIDYDALSKIAKDFRPKLIVAGFSNYSRVVDWALCRKIADSVGAYLLVDMAHVAGLIAAGEYPTPIPHAHLITSTTHKTLRGPRGGLILTNDGNLAKAVDRACFPFFQGGPLMHVIAAKAVAFKEALLPEFKVYQKKVVANARALANTLQKNGVPVLTGGTDNHLLTLDLRPLSKTGRAMETRLGLANITVNKNSLPQDPEPPTITSGIRLGTPALTTRGMGEGEMTQIGDWMARLLKTDDDESVTFIKEKVLSLCERFPIYSREAS